MKTTITSIFFAIFFLGAASMASAQTQVWGLTPRYDTVRSTIFKLDADGSNYQTVYTLPANLSVGGRLLKAKNGKLYGLGIDTLGVEFIFEYDAAFGMMNTVHTFDTLNGKYVLGLVQLPNGIIYGVSNKGGTYDRGVIFNFDPITLAFNKVYEWDTTAANGVDTYDELALATNGKLYGMTASGGTNDEGVIFEFDPYLPEEKFDDRQDNLH